jgi:hypothetical protein
MLDKQGKKPNQLVKVDSKPRLRIRLKQLGATLSALGAVLQLAGAPGGLVLTLIGAVLTLAAATVR